MPWRKDVESSRLRGLSAINQTHSLFPALDSADSYRNVTGRWLVMENNINYLGTVWMVFVDLEGKVIISCDGGRYQKYVK